MGKYLDEYNHMSETISVETEFGTKSSTFLVSEHNRVYDKIMIGDSIFKRKGELEINIKRKSQSFTYKLDYSCEDFK